MAGGSQNSTNGRPLLVTVSDSASGEVVGRKFQRNLVAVHDLDAIPPEPSGHGRKHCAADFDLYRKHASLELLDNLAHSFDRVFFWQMFLTFPVLVWSYSSSVTRKMERAGKLCWPVRSDLNPHGFR